MNERALLNELSFELENFQEKSPSKFNARCPVCGDSKKNKLKKRFWVLENNGSFLVHCFNCGYSTSLRNFAKTYYPLIYNKFAIDFYKKNDNTFSEIKKTSSFVSETKKNSDIIKSLLIPSSENNEIVNYLNSRKISKEKQKLIFYIKDFSEISKRFSKFKDSKFKKEERIILPIYNSDGDIVAIVSRGFKKNTLRYINLKFVEDVVIFGLYNSNGNLEINLNKPVYVVEGPIDSLFIDNCLAASTSDLLLVKEAISPLFPSKIKFTFIPDNDRRNKEIIDVYKKIVKDGENVVVFPENIKEKDINDMVKHNVDILSMISKNTFNGLRATAEINRWKKI